MSSEKKRVAFYLSEEDLKELDRLKQLQFYDKPYSEMFRQLIKLGLKAASRNA